MTRWLLSFLLIVQPVLGYAAEISDLPADQVIGVTGRAELTSPADGEWTMFADGGGVFSALNFNGRGSFMGWRSGASDLTTSTLTTSGDWAIYKNTTSGDVYLAINDGGAVKIAYIGDDSAKYENGGAYELNVGGLSGELADPQTVTVGKGGTDVAAQPEINFVEGSNVTITATDDAVNNRVNVAIAAAGGTSESSVFFNPKDYYEVGDGDDWQPAIQRCFDAMQSQFDELTANPNTTNNRSMVCVFPAGEYPISDTCYLPHNYISTESGTSTYASGGPEAYVLLLGYGATIEATGDDYPLFVYPEKTGAGQHPNTCQSFIEGFIFKGQGGIERALADRGTVTEDHLDPVQCVPNVTQAGIRFNAITSACEVSNCRFGNLDCAVEYAGFNFVISTCHIGGCTVGIYVRDDVQDYSYSTTYVINSVRFIQMQDALHAIGLWMEGVDNVYINNFTCEGTSGKYGILWDVARNYGYGDQGKPSFDVHGVWVESGDDPSNEYGWSYGSVFHWAGGFQTGQIATLDGVRGRISVAHAQYATDVPVITEESANGSMTPCVRRPGLTFGATGGIGNPLGKEYDAADEPIAIQSRCWARMSQIGENGVAAAQQYVKYQDGTYAAPAQPWHPTLSGKRSNTSSPTWDTSAQAWGYRYYSDGDIVYYKGKVYQFSEDVDEQYNSPGPDPNDTGIQYPDVNTTLWTELGTASWLPEGQAVLFAKYPGDQFASTGMDLWNSGNSPKVTWHINNMVANPPPLNGAAGYLFDNAACPSWCLLDGVEKQSTSTWIPWTVVNGRPGVTSSETAEVIASSGSIGMSNIVTQLDAGDGALTMTTPSGAYVSQRKTIVLTDAANTAEVNIYSHVDGVGTVSYTLASVYDYVTIEWLGSRWATISASVPQD